MKLLIKDDFLDDVNLLRDKALQFNFDCSEDFSFDPGWRGYRTKKLKLEDDKFINSCSDKILTEVSKFFNIEGYTISTYFHVSYLKTKETLAKFEDEKYHTDHTEYAGVLYLHPNPPKGTGTSVLDGENNKIIQVENVYNRLVCYPGISLHAPSNLFGDVIENGRMTCSFFISKYLGWSTN